MLDAVSCSIHPARARLNRALVLAALLALAAPAFGQETREGQIAAQQFDKASRLRPYEPEKLERRFEMLDDIFMAPARPVYPFVGSVFDGGGLAVGPGYRTRYADTGAFDAHAAWSIRNYRTVDATLTLPAFADRRVSVSLNANWLDAPEVAFYGVGSGSRTADRTNLAYRATTIGATARVRASRSFAVGGGFSAIAMEQDADPGSPARSVSPTYGRSHVFAEFDSRTSPRYTRRGSLYRVELADYRQTNGSDSGFSRVDAEAQRFVPLLRDNWVIAMRALVSTTATGSGQDVPDVLLPDLGGHHTLRGYSAWRFRDRHRVLLTGEYRWTAGSLVDMALFLDAGKVVSKRSDLDLNGLIRTYGIGVSFHTPTSTILRVELARTSEGSSLLLSFGPSF